MTLVPQKKMRLGVRYTMLTPSADYIGLIVNGEDKASIELIFVANL